MGPAVAVIGALATVAGVAVSLSAASRQKREAEQRNRLEKQKATMEAARVKASLHRTARSRTAAINVAAAAGGTLGASTVEASQVAIGSNVARESRDIDKMVALGAKASDLREASARSAASSMALSSVIQGVSTLAQSELFEKKG